MHAPLDIVACCCVLRHSFLVAVGERELKALRANDYKDKITTRGPFFSVARPVAKISTSGALDDDEINTIVDVLRSSPPIVPCENTENSRRNHPF